MNRFYYYILFLLLYSICNFYLFLLLISEKKVGEYECVRDNNNKIDR